MPNRPIPTWWKYEKGELVCIANPHPDGEMKHGDCFDANSSDYGYDGALLARGFVLYGNSIQTKRNVKPEDFEE